MPNTYHPNRDEKGGGYKEDADELAAAQNAIPEVTSQVFHRGTSGNAESPQEIGTYSASRPPIKATTATARASAAQIAATQSSTR